MQPYQDVLRPESQVSLSYPFLTALNLPPRQFLVSLPSLYARLLFLSASPSHQQEVEKIMQHSSLDHIWSCMTLYDFLWSQHNHVQWTVILDTYLAIKTLFQLLPWPVNTSRHHVTHALWAWHLWNRMIWKFMWKKSYIWVSSPGPRSLKTRLWFWQHGLSMNWFNNVHLIFSLLGTSHHQTNCYCKLPV